MNCYIKDSSCYMKSVSDDDDVKNTRYYGILEH